jgi:NAD-dependent dihydropyrimidine dehydrogenase PreA subunit
MPGTFIDVTVAPEVAEDVGLARRLEEVCPVDIFAAGPDGVRIVEAHLDECVLCGLCIEAAPEGMLTIHKLYSGETLPMRARAGERSV